MVTFLEIFKWVGAATGLLAFVWRIWDEFHRYLHLSIRVADRQGEHVLVHLGVENRSLRPKQLDLAFLLIGPADESPVATGRFLAHGRPIEISSTNELPKLFSDGLESHSRNDRAIIPLTYFSREQVRVADEILAYTFPISVAGLVEGAPYSVRSYLFADTRLHRIVQGLFIP